MLLKGADRSVGPVIAALGASQIIGYGALYYAYAVLAPGIAVELDVTEANLFAVFSIGLLIGAFTAPGFGRRLDRHGAPIVMATGSAVIAVLLAAVSAAPNFWVFAVLVILIEVISFTVLYDAAFATLARYAPHNTRNAITQLTLVAGFASTIFWPLTGWLAEMVGWRGTYLVFAGLNLGLALPLHLWISLRPVPGLSQHPTDGEIAVQARYRLTGASARRAFWLVGVGFALSGMVISAVSVHMVPILLARQMGDMAYLVAMMMGPAQVLIRIVDATLWRHLHPVAVALVAATALPLAVVALLVPGPAIVTGLGFAVLLGTGGGLSSIVRGAVPVALFGPDGLGLRLGRLAALRNLLGASAPFAFVLAGTHLGLRPTLYLTAACGFAGLLVMAALWQEVRRAKAV